MSDTRRPKNNFWLEFGPLLIFFLIYIYLRRTLDDPNTAIYPAAIVLAVASTLALAWTWIKHRTVSGVLIFSTVLVCFFAAMAYFLNDPRFFYIKPTVVSTIMGLAILGGVVFKKNVIRLMFGDAFELPDAKWNVLAIRWGLFFLFMAVINEFVWRTYSEDFWVKFKVFGFLPLSILFTMSQLPFIMKHGTVKGQEAQNPQDG